MTGHSRPQFPTRTDLHALPSTPRPKLLVPLPDDVHACQLQLLGQLLPNLLQPWRSKVGEAPPGQPCRSSGSNSSTQQAGPVDCDSELVQAVSAAGHWATEMALQPPPHGPDWQAADSVGTKAFQSSAASHAAVKLCALLENVCRMELAAGQQAPAKGDLGGLPARGQGQAHPALPSGVREAVHICLSPMHHNLIVGPLVDPIVINNGPDSKACKQLYSLLATLLKCSAWDGSQAQSGSQLAQYAYASCTAV